MSALRVPGERRVVAARRREVGGHVHITMLKLDDDTQIPAAEVVRQIDAHEAHYTMIPPPGSAAYEAFMETGLPLLLQVRQCPDCTERVVWG